MKQLLILLLLSSAALQADSVTAHPGGAWTCGSTTTPITCSAIERQHGFETYPLKLTTVGASFTQGTITGSSSSFNGGISTVKCAAGSSPCGTPGTNPDIYVVFDGYANDSLGPSGTTCPTGGTFSAGPPTCTYTATIPFNSGAFTAAITLAIVGYTSPTVVSPSGSFVGCSNDGSPATDLDNCGAPLPASAKFAASAGSSITDSTFGATVTTVVAAPYPSGNSFATNPSTFFDALIPNYNSDHSLIIMQYFNGAINILSSTSPFAVQWTSSELGNMTSGSSIRWSSLDPKTLYYISGKTIKKTVLGTAHNLVTDGATNNTYSGSANGLTDGGDSDLSNDNWWFISTDGTNSDKTAILADLNTGAMHTISYSGLTNFTFRNSSTGNLDGGVRYLVLQNQAGPNEVYSDNGTTLTDVGPMPQTPGLQASQGIYDGDGHCGSSCQAINGFGLGTGHAGICSIAGVSGFCSAIYSRIHSAYQWFTFLRFSAGVDKMAIDEAAGGGATMIFYMNHAMADTHIGPARFGHYAVVSSEHPGGSVPTRRITNAVTSGSNINLTLDAAGSGSIATGVSQLVNNVGGCTNANNGGTPWPAGNITVSGTTMTISGVTCNATYTSSTGSVIPNVSPYTSGPHYNEDIVFAMPSRNVSQMTAIRMYRTGSLCMSDTWLDGNPSGSSGQYNPYYCQQHTSLSMHASGDSHLFTFFESNEGIPDEFKLLTSEVPLTIEVPLPTPPFQLTVQLFGSLPTCNSGVEGSLSPVSDSTTNTWGATITGGGSNHVLAYCDGSNWTVAAK